MKNLKNIILLCLALCLALAITACEGHECTPSGKWQSDAKGHWNSCADSSCTEKLNYKEHTFGEGVETTPATEEAEGVMTYTCKTCGYEKTEAIEKLSHTHKYESKWSNDETHHWHASTCGHEAKDKAAHNFDDGFIEKPATDTEEGLIVYTCIDCGYYYDEVIGKTGHTHQYSEEWTFDENYHWHSATCGHSLKKNNGAHEYGKGEVTKEPTELEEGITSYFCKTCGYEKQEPIAKLPHTHKFAEEWTFDGQYHWKASACGHDETVVKYFHKFDEGKVTTAPTETADGEKTFTCVDCGQTKTEAVAALSHTHTYETTYSKDASYHWFAPTCAHTNAIVKTAHKYDANGNCVCGYHGVCETCGGCLTVSCTEHATKCAFADMSKVIDFVPQANHLGAPEGPGGLAPGAAGAYIMDYTIQSQFIVLDDGTRATLVTLPNGTSAHSGVSFWNNQLYTESGLAGYNVSIPQVKNVTTLARMHFTNMGTSEITFTFSMVDYYYNKGEVTVTLAVGETKTVLMPVTHGGNSVGLNSQIVFPKDAAVNAGVAIWGEFVASGLDKAISVNTTPEKTVFYVGESFTAKGLIIKGESSYSANAGQIFGRTYISKNYITSYAEGYVFTAADAGTKSVTVTFNGMTTSYMITVIDHASAQCTTCGKCADQTCEFPGCETRCEGHFDGSSLTVMSFNLGTNGVENEYNKPNLLNKLLAQMPDILGTQEENSLWTAAIKDTLERHGYKNIIMYREGMVTSNLGNEGAGIWYNSLRFELVDSGYFWMSDTPNTSSIWNQYGAIYKRVTTWAIFKDKASGKTFAYYNTHIGYESEELWLRSANMIMERMHQHYNQGYPVIITGDFNFALNTDGAMPAYERFMQGLKDPHYTAIVKNYEIGKENTFSQYGTYQGAGAEAGSDVGNRKHVLPIDYMLYSAGFVAEEYTILREELPEGVTAPDRQYFSSDHFAIKTVFSFNDDWGKHICWEPCAKCGLCLDMECEICTEKCPGHHKCDTLCPDCGLCANIDGECRVEHCPAYKITLSGATFEGGENTMIGCKVSKTIIVDSTKTFEGFIDSAKNYYSLDDLKALKLNGNVNFTALYQEDMLEYAASDKATGKLQYDGVSAVHKLKDGQYMTTITFAKGTEAGKLFAGRGALDSGSMPLNWCAPANGKNVGIIYIYSHAKNPVKIQYMTENYGPQNEELIITLQPGLNRIVLTFGIAATNNSFYSCDHQIILKENAAEDIVLDTYGYILADGLVSNIKLASAPTKLTYKVGETFSTEGMNVSANIHGYESGVITNATVDYEGRTFTADDLGTHTVKVTYLGVTMTFEIQVTE